MYRPDYRKYLSPEYYIFPKNELPHRPAPPPPPSPPSENEKNPEKIQAKAVEGHVL